MASSTTSIETKMKKASASFTSTFVGISGFPNELGAYTTSPLVELEDRFWSVRIYPGGFDEESKDHLSCFVCLENVDFSEVRASFKISAVNQKGWKNHEFSSSVKSFCRNVPIWGDSKFLPHANLKASTNGICVEDKLIIKVEMVIYGNIEHSVKPKGSFTISSPKKNSNLSQELSSILLSDSLADIKIIAGEVSIPAHKFMLCLRSEVFRAMLSNGMKESSSNEIHIPDFDGVVIKDLLQFIYTDECPQKSLESHGEMLLAASCKYQIKGLESICEVYLSSTINVTNVVSILTLANVYGRKQLKLCALQFAAHNLKAVIQTENFFDNLGFPLCQEIMMTVAGVEIVEKDD
jgi:hypothetical protein